MKVTNKMWIKQGAGKSGKLINQLAVVGCLFLLTITMAIKVPAQIQSKSNPAGNNMMVINPTLLSISGGLNQILNFFGLESYFSDDKTQENLVRQRPASPSNENDKETADLIKIDDPPTTSEALSCSFTGSTINVSAGGSIQAAINSANPLGGDKIIVAAGTYTEQIVVNKCVKITGAGEGLTIIESPATLTPSNVVGLSNTAAIVEIRSQSYVEMSKLTVTGPVPFSNSVSGIFINENSSLVLSNARVTAIHKSTGISGDQNGYGVSAGSLAYNQVGFINFDNVKIDDYNKNGVVVARTGSDGQIINSNIVGTSSPASPSAQNGIVIRDGATSTINNNTINNNICGSINCSFTGQYSFGILLYKSGTTIISTNTFDNNDAGVYSWTPNFGSTVNGNSFTQTKYAAISFDEGNSSANNNFVIGSSFGPVVGITAVSYNGNAVNSDVSLHSNSVTGASQAGIELYDENPNDSAFPTLTADFNRIAGNTVGIKNLTSSSTVNQTNNFWGCNQGPNGGTGCDTTSGLVNFATPYLILSHTNTSAASVGGGVMATIETNLRYNSAGTDTFTTANHLPNPIAPTNSSANNPAGIPVNFTATNGTVSPATTPLVDGLASTTFTGGTVDGGDQMAIITAKVDNATDTTNVTVLDSIAPTVVSSTGSLASSNVVNFVVTFSEAVTGVDATDFVVTTTSGNVVASITNVNCSGASCTVEVTVDSGMGSIRLDVLDDNSIVDTASAQNPLNGAANNPTFTGGTTLNIDVQMPTVTINQAATQPDPTNVSPINFMVVFNEPVNDFDDLTDVVLSGTATGATVVSITPVSTTTYTVAVNGGATSGTIIAMVPAGVAIDADNNGNEASTSTDNTVNYFNGAVTFYVDDDGMASASSCDDPDPVPMTIQAAIDLASAGDTINVCPGTYVEELEINKPLTLLGPNAGVNPNTGTRAAEAVINPTISDPDFSTGPIMVSLRAQNITFNGFTLDGNNPNLTSGVIFNGVDVDAAEGIDMPDNNFTGLANPRETITNNIIKNIGDLGIALGANGSANNDNSTIQFNKIDNIPGVNYGGGIYVGTNAYTNISDNVITRISLGIVTENFYRSGAAIANINNNQITANRIGIRHNLHYTYTTNGFKIFDNTITSYVEPADPGATRFSGIRIESINNTVPVTFSGNIINANRDVLLGNAPLAGNLKAVGSKFYNKQLNRREVTPKTDAPNTEAVAAAYTRIDGIWLTNTSTVSPNIVITGNNITNALRGISHTVPAVPNVNCNFIVNNDVGVYVGNDIQYGGTSSSYATNGINLNNNNIVGNTTFGVQSDTTGISNPVVTNAENNYWGAANGPGPVGPGNGDNVTTNVDYDPFLNAPTTCSPVVPPTVTINQVGPDPTNASTINFTVVFSEPVTGFTSSDVVLSGTAGATTAVITETAPNDGTTYNVAVSGMTNDGTVIATIPVGAAQSVATGSPTSASTSTDNTVTYDTTSPTVTINQASGQADPTNVSPINFTVVFSEPTTNFDGSDVTLSGTAGATTATVTGSGTTYNVAVSGMTSSGTVIATIGAGVATDAAGNGNTASTSTDNTVTYDITAPTVTVEQAAGQADPTSTSPINFTVVFSEAVTGFGDSAGDVIIGGTAFGAGSNPKAVITGSGTTYNVAVSGMNQTGTVILSVPAGAAVDNVGNQNAASTSSDNTVTFNLVNSVVVVSPVDTMNWYGFDDVTDTFIQPSFVEGPTGQPLGDGSSRIRTSDTGKYLFANSTDFPGTRFDQITELSYSEYANNPGNTAKSPSLQLGADFDLTDADESFQGRLVFEPYQNTTSPNQPLVQGTWQRWNATNGKFYTSRGTILGNPTLCPQSAPCTRAQLLAAYPNVGIHRGLLGLIGFRGEGSSPGVGFEGNVDALTVGVNSVNKTFDFEPAPPTISIGDATVTEGNSSTTTATFTITQSVVSTLDTTVTINTADGTATTADNDYQAIVNGTATIPAGQLSTTVTVNVNGDTNVEGNETFTVNLSNSVNAAIDDSQGLGTINNDDVTVGFSSATYSVGEGDGTASISVCRSGVTPNTVTVDYATSNGTATAPADYTATSGTLSFLPNETCKSFSIPIVDDNISEPPPGGETVNLTLSNPTGGATLGLASAILSIIDNDGGGLVTISGNIQMYNAPAANTNLQGVTVTLSGSASQTTTTDTNGNYSFIGLPAGGSYKVTPSGLSKIYDPVYRNYASLTVNITNANFTAYNSINDVPRKVRFGQATANPGNQVTVPILLDSLGNENGVSFSFTYDTTKLGNPVVTLGADAAGATLLTNTGTPGSVGVTVVKPSGQTFGAAGTKQIVNVQFNTAANTSANTALTFTNSPTTRSVNDVNANPLQSQFNNGVVVFAQGLEADVDPRPSGDGDVDLGDFNQVGQFAAGLATPDFATTNEFQRADSEPTATKGDGDVDLGDFIQAGRYAAILDPVQTVGGPAYPAMMTSNLKSILDNDKSLATPRVVSAANNVNGSPGNKVTVAISIDAQANDKGTSFTMDYVTTKLSNPQVSLGSGGTGGFLVPNTNMPGKVIVQLAYINGGFQAGVSQIILIQFDVAASAPGGLTFLNFNDDPVQRQVRDTNNLEVAATFNSGSVNILAPTAAGVSVKGQVVTASMKGLADARLTLTDGNGQSRTITSNSFGYFTFEDVQPGQSYTLQITSRRYRFNSMVLTVDNSLDGLNIIAIE